eukprot:5700396-Pyramimonas_sp.AAC.1
MCLWLLGIPRPEESGVARPSPPPKPMGAAVPEGPPQVPVPDWTGAWGAHAAESVEDHYDHCISIEMQSAGNNTVKAVARPVLGRRRSGSLVADMRLEAPSG